MTSLALLTVLLMASQDKPVDIAKKDLPKEAECVVCSAGGEAHGKEKAAAGVMYKGKPFYFCNSKEVAVFKKDPESYMPVVVPRKAPEFKMHDLSRKLWDAEAMSGKVVLIDFWATWCAPCKKIMPLLESAREKYAARGFEVLSVSVDQKRADLDKFLKTKSFANPVLHDTTQTFSKWGVKYIPALFLIKDGQIVAQWTGELDRESLEAQIEAALKPAG